MKTTQRPLSPFMIGPYYKPQMTSMMSITHRATGVFLSIVGIPLLLWFLIAVAGGPESYNSMLSCLGGWLGRLVLGFSFFCLSFHLLNGIRHLVWDTGRALDMKTATTAGWLVLIGTAIMTVVLVGVTL